MYKEKIVIKKSDIMEISNRYF